MQREKTSRVGHSHYRDFSGARWGIGAMFWGKLSQQIWYKLITKKNLDDVKEILLGL